MTRWLKRMGWQAFWLWDHHPKIAASVLVATLVAVFAILGAVR